MKNSVKGKFEDAWHKAFENAELAPSEDVWTGVEQGLNIAETVTMKRRVVFYQRLAAAAVLFALLLGGLTTYYISDLTDQQKMTLFQQNSSEFSSTNETNDVDNQSTLSDEGNEKTLTQGESSVDFKPKIFNENTSGNSTDYVAKAFYQTDQEAFIMRDEVHNQKIKNQTAIRNYPSLLSMIPAPSLQLAGSVNDVTIVRKLPAMPSAFMNSKSHKETRENLWAALGASTGSYSPSVDLGAASSSNIQFQTSGNSSAVQSAYSTTESKGSVFSVGMNLGKRISRRWLVLGGVSYLNQAIGYTSNFAVLDASNNALASVADYTNLKSFSSVVATSTPYQINSVNEFISIPIQAGYLLVDEKIGLQLNSGVSTDIFMQNTLTDKSGQLETYSSGAGDTSPFRTVSWAGLLGTELSYKIATQYRISVVPGLRYSLNSVLKSDSAPSNPLVWDVGFRLRYNFK
jgi:hypothetical protein